MGRKILLDGSGGGGTARMSEPNAHDGKYGILYLTQEELDEAVWEAHSRGCQIAAHGIGDVAIRMILDAYKKAQDKLPRPDARHRIEHCSFAFPDIVERIVKEKVYPLFHPSFLYYFGEAHLRNFTIDRVQHEFPFRSALDKGVVVGNGSDSPVTLPDPRPAIYSTITRKSALGASCGEAECVTASEALWTYTYAGAFLTFDEKLKGTLEPGKLADFAVVDVDPTTCDPEAILDMNVEKTVLGGVTVFEK
jgi:predicted amidohydrolase YtcJ